MIIVYHNRVVVLKIFDFIKNQEITVPKRSIHQTLLELAQQNEDTFIGWCHEDLEKNLNVSAFQSVFHHDLIMASFTTSGKYILSPAVGYVENSTAFLKVNHSDSYPTWLMSSDVGAVHARVLNKFKQLIKQNIVFDIFLNHVSKRGIKRGLFCYSEPTLLDKDAPIITETHSKNNLFSFVKNHYKGRWQILLLLNYFLYEKRIKLGAFMLSLFTSKIPTLTCDFSDIKVESRKSQAISFKSYDVLIPTLGRAKYLEDVLKDLSNQTIIPTKIIIVEQNGIKDSKTELNYIYDTKWPFEIDHTLIHQMGACNARNIALSKVTSDWVFFADDDIRLEVDLVSNVFKFIKKYGISATTMASLMANEKLYNTIPMQWYTFSTNSSFVSKDAIKDITFGMEHEFGFGEDSDFGMKIRNEGTDIVFYPNTQILHLKAPTGGFRTKPTLLWEDEDIQPKPSPSVMSHRLKHLTEEQLFGYRTTLFFKFFGLQSNKNPFTYYRKMKKAWDKSIYWAKELIKKHSANAV